MPSAAIGRSQSRRRASTASRSRTSICWRSATTKEQMVPLGTLVNVRQIGGPVFVYRYNGRTASSITGSLKPGVSSGEVIKDVERTADETLLRSMKIRMDRVDVHADPRRGHDAAGLFLGRDVRVSGPLRALRKLGVAAGGDPGGAACACSLPLRACWRATGWSTSSCRSAWSCWWGWPARIRS